MRVLARGQRDMGARVRVAAVVEPAPAPHPFVAALREEGLDVHVFAVPPRRYLRERAAVRAFLERTGPHVVHTHGYRTDVLDAPVARRMGIPTVSTVHGVVGNGARNRAYEALQRRSLRRADGVVAVARPQVDALVRAGVARERIRLLPNAWSPLREPLGRAEARRALRLEPGATVVGFVGRLGPEKGADVLLRAAALEPGCRPTLCFLGGGREAAALRALAEDLGLAPRVAWRGPVPDAGRLMAAFDVLALPSRTEGTPVVLFEASRAGVPVVASAVGGVPDVLGEGFNLVPPDDDRALAGALARILARPSDAEGAVRRAAARIRGSFDPEGWIRGHLELYADVAGRARQRVRPAPAGAAS